MERVPHHVFFGAEANYGLNRNNPDQLVTISIEAHRIIHHPAPHETKLSKEYRERCKEYLINYYRSMEHNTPQPSQGGFSRNTPLPPQGGLKKGSPQEGLKKGVPEGGLNRNISQSPLSRGLQKNVGKELNEALLKIHKNCTPLAVRELITEALGSPILAQEIAEEYQEILKHSKFFRHFMPSLYEDSREL